MGEALLHSGEPGVVAEVAAVVVADQDPGVAVQDPEAGDRQPSVWLPTAPYQIRSSPTAGVSAHSPHRVDVRVAAAFPRWSPPW